MKKHTSTALLVLFATFFTFAANGSNTDPYGVAGNFNGFTLEHTVEPFNGHAYRVIQDIQVNGAIGRPLEVRRYYNTERPGGWTTNYDWVIAGSQGFASSSTLPTDYPVYFPSGNFVDFKPSNTDTQWRGAAGTPERLIPTTSSLTPVTVTLADGGQIEWTVTHPHVGNLYYYVYTLSAIIDPYGIKQTVTYPHPQQVKVTDPAGRSLTLTYSTDPTPLLTSVLASDGRAVTYTYTTGVFGSYGYYKYLSSVHYFGDPLIRAASYTMTTTYDLSAPPSLHTAYDPMYPGALKQVKFAYRTVFGSQAGQIETVSHTSGSTDVTVATLDYPSANTRILTRGDGKTQTTTYADGVRLTQTDWNGKRMSWTHNASKYITGYIPPGGAAADQTTFLPDPTIGKVTLVTFPAIAGLTATRKYTYDSLYYLKTSTDQRNNTTTYTHDPITHRVTQIHYPDYPNGVYETWSWNGFGEPLMHYWMINATTGATESWTYDSRGMMVTYRDPVHDPIFRTGNPTYRYVFDSLDRLWKVTDALGHTTVYLYNNRGSSQWKSHGDFDQQFVTQITYPDATSISYTYDVDGNRTVFTNELGKKWTYAYDDYRRMTSSTDPLGRTTTYSYVAPGSQLGPYATTWDQPWVTTLPSGKITTQGFDANFRLIQTGKASGLDAAYSGLAYENDGDLLSGTDPQNRRTFLNVHDVRHRLTSVENVLNQVTTYAYDAANNKTMETRADNAWRSWSYDAMNRVTQTRGFDGDVTQYSLDYIGDITQITDAKGAIYTPGWDLAGRKSTLLYPLDALSIARTESWTYDVAGNLWKHTTPGNNVNTLLYDSRNRLISSDWTGGGHTTTYSYDAAGRLQQIANPNSFIVNTYNAAGDLIAQSQTIHINGLATTNAVNTPVDADGRRSSLGVAGVYGLGYAYTPRGQLDKITTGASTWFQFLYDISDNRTEIENELIAGALSTQFVYDPHVDRVIRTIQSINAGATQLSNISLYYTPLNNKILYSQNALDSNHGDRYAYSLGSQQVITAFYDATRPQDLNPAVYASREDFNVDSLKRRSATKDGVPSVYTAAPDGLNQYTNVGINPLTWDVNLRLRTYRGVSFVPDVEGQLASVSGNGHNATFSYDGLHRLVKQVLDGVTTYFTYDNWNPIVEWDGSGNLLARNVFGPNPNQILIRLQGGHYYQYASDHRGHPALLLDTNNTVLEKYTYTAFGTPAITDANGVPRTQSLYGNTFLYGGNRYLGDFGIYFMQMRWYMPELGQFLTTDPLGFDGGDNNLYRYVAGDPVNFSDPSGLTTAVETTDFDIGGWRPHLGFGDLVGIVGTTLGGGWGGFITGLAITQVGENLMHNTLFSYNLTVSDATSISSVSNWGYDNSSGTTWSSGWTGQSNVGINDTSYSGGSLAGSINNSTGAWSDTGSYGDTSWGSWDDGSGSGGSWRCDSSGCTVVTKKAE